MITKMLDAAGRESLVEDHAARADERTPAIHLVRAGGLTDDGERRAGTDLAHHWALTAAIKGAGRTRSTPRDGLPVLL